MFNMNKLKILFSILLFYTGLAKASDLILTQDSFGPISLKKGSKISLEFIKKAFPQYFVTYDIASWEGPDFHSIRVYTHEGRPIFKLASYISDQNYETEKNAKEFPIHSLVIGPEFKDQYGIKCGDRLDKVFRVRGNNLELISNHFNNSIGNNKIFYTFSIQLTKSEIEAQHGINYKNPSEVTLDEIKYKNPEIGSIEWIDDQN